MKLLGTVISRVKFASSEATPGRPVASAQPPFNCDQDFSDILRGLVARKRDTRCRVIDNVGGRTVRTAAAPGAVYQDRAHSDLPPRMVPDPKLATACVKLQQTVLVGTSSTSRRTLTAALFGVTAKRVTLRDEKGRIRTYTLKH